MLSRSHALANFGATLMVFSFVRGGNYWLVRGMSPKIFQELGRRSYVIYLIHFPLFMIIEQIADGRQKLEMLGTLAYLPALVIGTELIHRYVEKPAIRYFRKAPAVAGPTGEHARRSVAD